MKGIETIVLGGGAGRLSAYGKRVRASMLFERGKSFVLAAVMLQGKGGDGWVVLHLLCQGIEVGLKAVLLFADYDTFKGRLGKRADLDHNLISVLDVVEKQFGKRLFRSRSRTELEELNAHYIRHHLRYGSILDILVDPGTIPFRRVLRRSAVLIRLAERHIVAEPR